jgi:cobalt-zinc-cadmium efflux system outer membrane protein
MNGMKRRPSKLAALIACSLFFLGFSQDRVHADGPLQTAAGASTSIPAERPSIEKESSRIRQPDGPSQSSDLNQAGSQTSSGTQDKADRGQLTGSHPGHDMPGPSGPTMTMADLEALALKNNPTLAQAESAIRAAEGRRLQAGLFPNPIVGYEGDEFAFKAFTNKSEHFFFVEQTVPLGGKLSKGRRVFEKEASEEEVETAGQKQRVLNAVRMLYYQALAAQQQVDLRTELTKIAQEATETTNELLNVGQADRPDYLEAEIEAEQVELELENAKNNLRQVWQLLASVVGAPEMPPARLAGDLEENIPTLDQSSLTAALLRDSPEIRTARADVERARAAVVRAKAERVPDLFLRGAIGYSTEQLDVPAGGASAKTGPEASVSVGFTLPIFNRNQGGIAEAEAQLATAEREVDRVGLTLRARMAQAFSEYYNALAAVHRYHDVILPRARQAYEMYLANFKHMAASYPQVLIAQRTMFQVRESYVTALANLRADVIQIEGFLLVGGLDAPRDRPSEQPSDMTGAKPATPIGGTIGH